MKTNYSLHKIKHADQFSFDPCEYSRFKYGDDLVAEKFGTNLAMNFIKYHLSLDNNIGQLVVISSPFAFIPTATFAMKNYFVYELNKWLATNDHPVVHETKIFRTITYKEDYGELDASERMRLIGNDSFHIDKSFLIGKKLVFLDDIRITGSHEKMINKMIAEYGIDNDIYLLYFAELINTVIHPNIENTLNYSAVNSIFDLQPIIDSQRFAINTRIVKYLLNSDSNAFRLFVLDQDPKFLNLLYNMALGNGYHTIDAYRTNLQMLHKHLNRIQNTGELVMPEN